MNRFCPLALLPLLLLSPAAAAQEIVLPDPTAGASEQAPASVDAPDAGSGVDMVIEAAPALRDGAASPAQPATAPLRLSGLAPVQPLPGRVAMGASLSQPGILRLTGEVAAITLALDLPEDAPASQPLRLSLRSSVNVLPDTAAMQVSVNDAAPVTVPLRNFADFQTVELPDPLLKPGPNLIRLSVRQPHRIFCGPDASFGVWTEVELSRSGVALTAAAAPSAQDFARALAQQVRSGLPLIVLTDANADPVVLRQLTDALGEALHGEAFARIGSAYDMAPRGAASVLLVAADQARLDYRLDGRGAPVMAIGHHDGMLPDMTDALQAIEAQGPVSSAVPSLTPGQPVTLAELGQDDIIGNTHYFRHDIAFRLPEDWLLLANQKARLDLHYGHADNLPKGAILLVKVNDQTIRLLPLDRDGGRLLPPLKVGFAARLLHGGENRLSVEMMVPGNPSDIACPPLKTDMLVIAQDSRLTVPPSPAMQLPGLSIALSGLVAAGIQPDPQAIDPARVGLAAAQLAAGLPPAERPDPGASVLVTDFSGLPASLADVSQRALQEALFPDKPAPQAPAVPRAPRFRLSETGETPAPATDRRWSPLAWLAHQGDRIADAAFLASGESLSDWLAGRRGDALLIAMDRAQPLELALVLGPEAEMQGIAQALRALIDSGQGHGAAALLSSDGNWQLWSPVAPPLLQERVTAANLFPILGNYASWSPFLFACLLLGLGVLSVVPALAVVILYRKWRLR